MADLYEILYAGTDGPYPSACDIWYYIWILKIQEN